MIFIALLCHAGCSLKGDEQGGDKGEEISDEKGDENSGFVPLFDGTSLNGWVIPEKAIPHWKAVDGILENQGVGRESGSLIWTEREDYKDFILKVDWRLPGEPSETMHPLYDYNGDRIVDEHGKQVRKKGWFAGDSGIFLRGVRFKKDVPESEKNRFINAHFNIWSNPMGSGENHGYMVNKEMPPEVRRGAIPIKNADKPLGEWNTFVITLKGEHVTVVLNGEQIIDMNMPELPEMGAIGLQQHSPARDAERPFPIQFKNVLIKEL